MKAALYARYSSENQREIRSLKGRRSRRVAFATLCGVLVVEWAWHGTEFGAGTLDAGRSALCWSASPSIQVMVSYSLVSNSSVTDGLARSLLDRVSSAPLAWRRMVSFPT